jgi:hypothetical protein
MKLATILLFGLCVGLLIDRQNVAAEEEKAALEQRADRGNWIQDRIRNTPRMLEAKAGKSSCGSGGCGSGAPSGLRTSGLSR